MSRRLMDPQPIPGKMHESPPADMPGAQMRYLPEGVVGVGNAGWYWITYTNTTVADAELTRLRRIEAAALKVVEIPAELVDHPGINLEEFKSRLRRLEKEVMG